MVGLLYGVHRPADALVARWQEGQSDIRARDLTALVENALKYSWARFAEPGVDDREQIGLVGASGLCLAAQGGHHKRHPAPRAHVGRRRDTARAAEQRDRGKMRVVAAEDGEIGWRLRE